MILLEKYEIKLLRTFLKYFLILWARSKFLFLKRKGRGNNKINHIIFMLELGKGFALVYRQGHIRKATWDFFIDLVFYTHILKCFVTVELKNLLIKIFGSWICMCECMMIWKSFQMIAKPLVCCFALQTVGEVEFLLFDLR